MQLLGRICKAMMTEPEYHLSADTAGIRDIARQFGKMRHLIFDGFVFSRVVNPGKWHRKPRIFFDRGKNGRTRDLWRAGAESLQLT
jgi:hypothetical protein